MSSSASSSTSGSNYRRKKLSRSTQTRKAVYPRQAPRTRRRGSVTFQNEAAVIPPEEGGAVTRQELGLREADDEGEEGSPRRLWPFFRVYVEKKHLRLFFRVCAFVNVLSLILSAPFVGCSLNEDERCNELFVWFVVIVCVDFIVSLVYTLQVIARIEYAVYLHVHRDRALQGELAYSSYTTWYRILNLIAVTVGLWWSVAIGVARSVWEDDGGRDINHYLYIPVAFRGLAVFTTIQLFLNVQVPLSLKELLGNIKWKQLFFVALFYLFFLYIYALMGVQLLGGLGHRCVYVDPNSDELLLAIPVTHCSPERTEYQKQCYGGSLRDEIECRLFPNDSGPFDFNFRNEVYFGQFRFIIDAVFAVYEATSLELWSFFSYTASDGAPSRVGVAGLFYLSMIFYLVIFVQQSIFLVVIIESFADLRSARGIGTSQKPKDKPLIVLTEQASATDLSDRLKLQTQRTEESVQFTKSLDKWYYDRVEKIFLGLVAMDAIITALKHTDMNENLATALQVWQGLVSVLFVFEVVGLVIFHLANTNQHSLFLRKPYYWYLAVLAVGGLVAAIPFAIYHPTQAGNGLAVFQAARLPRLVRVHKTIKAFFFKIVGDGTKLFVIIVLTGIFLMFFAVINMQFFGYVRPDGQCQDIDNNHSNFFLALQSMFQLIMQEGWSEVMSEAMCHRPTWFLINIYFICLHLFASLILLNFFVAVILDNLDYDEETKKELLQQVVEKKTTQKVPVHLKVLTACGPKLISAPKISAAVAAGVEVPNLTEADVKSFYEAGEAKDVKEAAAFSAAAEQAFHQQQTVSSTTMQRRSSELSQLQLLSLDSNVSSASSHHERFRLIQGILESVRWLRKQNTDQEGQRPGLEGSAIGGLFRGRRSQETSQPVEDEYDQYRAKYRLFDSALFLMSPDNRLRRFCKAILTRQMSEPLLVKSRLTPIKLVKKFSYYGRYIVSSLPYFTWLMVVVTLSAIAVQLEELQTDFDRPDLINGTGENPTKMEPTYIWVADLLFVLFTLVELTLKILANGFFLNPDAAIRSVWDVMDWAVVLSTTATLIINTVTCGPAAVQTVVFTHLPSYVRVILCVRALRPLRTISLVPQMRRVISDVLLGWKQLLFGVLVLLFAIFMFASLGVQLFAGDYPQGPQAFCNDPSKSSLVECLNNSVVSLFVSTSREFLPNSNYTPSIIVPTVWYTSRRDFSFDNTLQAMLTMFEVLTLEGWLDVRDMLAGESVRPGIPRTQEAWYMAIFLHIFIFFGVNIGLQLFVGIVVNNFNAHKPGNSALLSVAQKRWTDLVLRISLLRPIKRPQRPSENRFRQFLYRIVINHRYRDFSTAVIILQSFCFILPWNTGDDQPPHRTALMSLVILFALYFILEQCVKLLAFGPKGFFRSWRNIADIGISLLGICYVMWAVVVLASGRTSTVVMLSNFALTYAILKCFTILGKYGIMQNLSITVVRTLIGSTPLMCVLFFIMLTYAFVGDIIFNNLRTGEDITFSRAKFDGAFPSFYLALRVMTGEDWHHLMRDAMIGGHYCSNLDGNCGNAVAAIVWFISYYILITVFLLNIVIAHLLENFSIFYNEDDTELSHAVIKDFKENWFHFDKMAKGTIKFRHIKLFLRTLRLQHYYTYSLSENNGLKLKARDRVPLLTDRLILREMAEELQREHRGGGGGGERTRPGLVKQLSEETGLEEDEHHSFQSVLKMLAYRAEVISERLEPQELYDRQEFEESLQFDVAEECILKWIKKYVQPVLEQQEEGHATIEEHHNQRYVPPPRVDSLWPMEGDAGLTHLSVDTDDEGDDIMSPLLSNNPILMRKWLGSPSLPTSEDLPEPPIEARDDHQSHEEKLVAQSYSHLAQISLTPFTQGGGAGGEDRWHDWFKMQREWSEQVDSSKQNYFDDGL